MGFGVPKRRDVTLVTPAAFVNEWTRTTLEQHEIPRRLAAMGVQIILNRGVTSIRQDHVETNCMFTGQRDQTACDAVLLVSSRLENNAVYNDLRSVKLIGVANAPGPIA